MGLPGSTARGTVMWLTVSLALLATTTALPSFVFFGRGHGGYSGHRVPHCIHQLEDGEREVCRYEPERMCETKTQTYKVITGYEKGDCKEIEVCRPSFYHKREASGYGYIECEKEKKEVCKREPTVEEKEKEYEVCRYERKEVCEMKTVKVPQLLCEDIEEKKERMRRKKGKERKWKRTSKKRKKRKKRRSRKRKQKFSRRRGDGGINMSHVNRNKILAILEFALNTCDHI